MLINPVMTYQEVLQIVNEKVVKSDLFTKHTSKFAYET